MPQLGPEYDLAQRVAKLERALSTVLQGLGQAFSNTQSDGSIGMDISQSQDGTGASRTRWYQGPDSTTDPNTGQHPVFSYIGELAGGGTVGTVGQIWCYPSGADMIVVNKDGYLVFDQAGNIVRSGDSLSGEGIARPWLVINSPAPTFYSMWPSTTSTSPTLIAQSWFDAQQPKVYWSATLNADAGTTGQVQLVLNQGGSPSVATPLRTVAAGGTTYINDVLTLPQPFWDQSWSLSVMAAVTGGTGAVRCQTFELTQRQS